jgi:hypothetical protein
VWVVSKLKFSGVIQIAGAGGDAAIIVGMAATIIAVIMIVTIALLALLFILLSSLLK